MLKGALRVSTANILAKTLGAVARKLYPSPCSETETVYRGYVEAENAVVWTNNRRAVTGDSDRFGETYDSVGYKAEIHKKDIIAVIHGRCETSLIFHYKMYVLDPDKLQNIEPVYLNELCNWDYPDVDDWDYPDVDDWDEWAE